MPKRTNGRGVAAAFARQQEATNSNDQFFSTGRVLYSYGQHWPLAVWHEGKVYMNRERYSSTTSKHASFAMSALVQELPDWRERVIDVSLAECKRLAHG